MILVTGSQGNVGREVVERLSALGAPVLGTTRDPARATSTVRYFDFERIESVGPALEGVRSLFLMRPPAIADVKRRLFPVIDAARRQGVGHVVFLSLLGAERNPWVPHRHVERYLEASGVPHTFLRPSFFMQNLATTHRADIRERDEVFVPAGHGKTSFIDARDVAAVAAKVLTEPGHEGRAYPLTGPEALGYDEVARVLSDVLGRPIRYADPWTVAFARRMLRQGHPLPFVMVMVGIYATAKFGLAAHLTGDTARLLGRPALTFRQFALDYQATWR